MEKVFHTTNQEASSPKIFCDICRMDISTKKHEKMGVETINGVNPKNWLIMETPWKRDDLGVPFGTRLHNYGKSPFFVGQRSISMGHGFKVANCHYQRVPPFFTTHHFWPLLTNMNGRSFPWTSRKPGEASKQVALMKDTPGHIDMRFV